MIKLDTDSNFDNDVEDYIREIQSKLPNYNVDVNNVNDFATMLAERENCNKCRGLNECVNSQKGYFTDYKDNEFKFIRCKYASNNNSNIINYYLPERLLNSTIDKYDTNSESRVKIFKYVTSFVNDLKNGKESKGLYIYGGYSKGKTYALAMIANLLDENKIKCVITYFPDLSAKLRNDYYSDKDSYDEIIENLKNTPVLLIDDFGSENMTDWLRDEVLGPLFNYRMSMGLPVFITSNVEPKALKDHIAIDNKNPDNSKKADRIINRLQIHINTKCVDDCEKYNR